MMGNGMKFSVSATFVALLLACGCEGGADTQSSLPSDSGLQAGPYSGDWRGVTSQSKPIVFRVDGNVVTYLRFEYEMAGSGCKITGKQMRAVKAPIANAAFTVSESSSGSSSVVAGTFASDSAATGTFSGSNSTGCSAIADATWQADKLPPAPSYDGTWTGQTSQAKSFSMTVSNNQIASLDLEYTLDEPCVTITSFHGAPAGSTPIVAGEADFSHGRSPLMLSGVVTFSEAGPATGSLDISYYDSATQPACSDSAAPTFTLNRQ
jgi:hypothetical protein